MCAICGCSDSDSVIVTNLQTGQHVHVGEDDAHDHKHAHGPDHFHTHGTHDHHHNLESHDTHANGASHTHAHSRTLKLEHDILARNNLLAERNRGWFAGRNILALNFMSSPGAGKTTLLERMIVDLQPRMSLSVIEGDQATLKDAERIRNTGCRVVQINTGAACHLDATMLAAALKQLNPPSDSTVLIENVGNLVCPALFDLGEHTRVVVASVTEGDDKPHKYPHMFRGADVIILNKTDLLPYVKFDTGQFVQAARELNPGVQIFPASAASGKGLEEWYGWIRGLPHKTTAHE